MIVGQLCPCCSLAGVTRGSNPCEWKSMITSAIDLPLVRSFLESPSNYWDTISNQLSKNPQQYNISVSQEPGRSTIFANFYSRSWLLLLNQVLTHILIGQPSQDSDFIWIWICKKLMIETLTYYYQAWSRKSLWNLAMHIALLINYSVLIGWYNRFTRLWNWKPKENCVKYVIFIFAEVCH